MDIYDENKIIEDIKNLVKIPFLRGIICHRIERYKLEYMDKIDKYENIVEIFEPGKKKSYPYAIFEITRDSSGWNLSIIQKSRPNFNIPEKAFKEIIHCKKPGRVLLKHAVKVGAREFYADFKREEDYITGMITEKTGKNASISRHPEANSLNGSGLDEEDRNTAFLRIFAQYILENEDFLDYLLSMFFSTWKPYIDSSCISRFSSTAK